MDTDRREVSMMQASSRERTRKPRRSGFVSEDLVREIASLSALDTTGLRQKWKGLFGADPSPHFGRAVLVRTISYRIQETALGGLKPATQRFLDRIAEGRSETGLERFPKRRVEAGTVLIRKWGGITHRVVALEHGVTYRNRRYKSLSEVARAITGARWSGPLFFGLKRQALEAANG
jgi:hypothetical protein